MRIWNNVGVATKILFAFSVLVLLLVGIGGAGYIASTNIHITVERLFSSKIPAIDLLIEADRDLQQALVAERTMFFVEPDSEIFKQMQEDFEANVGQVIERTDKYFKVTIAPGAQPSREKFSQAMAAWRPIAQGIVADIAAGREDQALRDKEVGEALVAFEAMRDILDMLTELELKEATIWHVESSAEYDDLVIILLSGTVFSFVLAVVFAWVLTRSITGPVSRSVALAESIRHGDLSSRLRLDRKDEMGRLSAALDDMSDVLEERARLANAIAEGDLDQKVVLASEQDSLGQALSTMVENMNSALRDVKDASDQIAAGSSQVNSASQSLSQGSTSQAAAIEEINSSMTEISNQTRTNAENASKANSMMDRTVAVVGNGKQAGQDMAASMNEISEASAQVGKIIKVIDEIAFQTNLLALNAAVEAARAGRHGKGFAVVAEEVRNLAGRSAKAAQETTELIEGAVSKVGVGMELAKRLDEGFEEIVAAASSVASLVADIAASSNDQAQGVSQVNGAMNQVDQVTQQNTANAEQTASAATVLSDQAAQLLTTLERFRLRRGEKVLKAESAPMQALPQGDDEEWG